MNTRTIAAKLLTRHGPAAFPMVHARATLYRLSVRKAEQAGQYVGISRLMARRMVWDAVAHHVRDLSNS